MSLYSIRHVDVQHTHRGPLSTWRHHHCYRYNTDIAHASMRFGTGPSPNAKDSEEGREKRGEYTAPPTPSLLPPL